MSTWTDFFFMAALAAVGFTLLALGYNQIAFTLPVGWFYGRLHSAFLSCGG